MQLKLALLTSDSRLETAQAGASYPIFGTAPSALLEGFAGNPQIEVHVISCVQQRMSSPTELFKNIRFHCLYVPKWGWLRTGYIGCIAAVKKKLREIQPQIVHAQGTERDCAICGVFFSGPKVLTIHGNCRAIAKFRHSKPFTYWWLQAQLENFCLARFDGVVAISKYTQKLVSGLAKKTWLLPNAVDSRFFEIRPRSVSPVPALLVVANVDSRKNQVGLIRSLDLLSTQRKFQLRFFGNCGGDPYGKEFLGLVATRPWCFWGGMLDRENLRQELAKATAVILPTWEDNCPMVVLEAQAAGLAVIASNVGGVPDLVEDGLTGILTDPARAETMPTALEKLLDNPELARRIGGLGRERALARYHPKIIAEKHLEIYQEVIASR